MSNPTTKQSPEQDYQRDEDFGEFGDATTPGFFKSEAVLEREAGSPAATQTEKQLRPDYWKLPVTNWTTDELKDRVLILAKRAGAESATEQEEESERACGRGLVIAAYGTDAVEALEQAEEKPAEQAKQPEHTRTGNCWAFGLMEISNCTQHGKARGNCVECPSCPACSKEAVRSTEEICDDVMDHAYRLIDAGEAVEQPADAFPSHARRGERQYVIHGGKPLQIRPLVDEPAESAKPEPRWQEVGGGTCYFDPKQQAAYERGLKEGRTGRCGYMATPVAEHPAESFAQAADLALGQIDKGGDEDSTEATRLAWNMACTRCAQVIRGAVAVAKQAAPVAEDIAPRFQNAAAFMSNLEVAAEGEGGKTGWDAIEGLIGSVDGPKTGEEGKAAPCPFCKTQPEPTSDDHRYVKWLQCANRDCSIFHVAVEKDIWNRRAWVDPSSLSAERCYQVFRQIKWKGQDDWIISNATGEGKFILSWRGNARFIYDLEAARVITAWYLSHSAVEEGVR